VLPAVNCPEFKLERQMAPLVCEWLQNAHLTVKSEFSLPWGICDFVGISLNLNNVRKRLSLKQTRPIGPMQRVELLQHIPDQDTGCAISLEELERAYMKGTASRLVKTEVDKLIADRFVSKTSSGSLQKLNGWMPLQKRIVAVELKLARVSDVICQAAANRAFATESYVALPWQLAHRHAKGARASEFLDAGVGVVAVAERGCRVVLRPSTVGIHTDPILQAHCVERFWRSRGSSTSAALQL
jgi:hypothetical protein